MRKHYKIQFEAKQKEKLVTKTDVGDKPVQQINHNQQKLLRNDASGLPGRQSKRWRDNWPTPQDQGDFTGKRWSWT